jgi:hypothetical protein
VTASIEPSTIRKKRRRKRIMGDGGRVKGEE